MLKRSSTYKRRYNSILSIDTVSDDNLENAKAINSYTPSKYTSLTDTLIGSIGEDGFFNYTDSDDTCYSDDITLLNFATDCVGSGDVLEGVDTESKREKVVVNKKESKLNLLLYIILGVVATALTILLL